jgi:chromosome segregation ATPase
MAFLRTLAALLPSLSLGLVLRLDASEGANPVARVVTLLQDIQNQLEGDATEDENNYKKLVCWCKTAVTEKQQAIAAGKARIDQLQAKIGSGVAKSAGLGSEIKVLRADLDKTADALEQANAMRKLQVAQFQKESQDIQNSIDSIHSGLGVLNGSQPAPRSFLQLSDQDTEKVNSVLRREIRLHRNLLEDSLSDSLREQATEFLEESAEDQQVPGSSGAMSAVLQQMLGNFQKQLANLKQEDANNAASYNKLIAAKRNLTSSSTSQVEEKTLAKATLDVDVANGRKELDALQNTLKVDTDFLASSQKKCDTADADMNKRQQARSEESLAISKAIEVLSSDSARATFAKSSAMMFLQEGMTRQSRIREEVVRTLSAASSRLHSSRLQMLAWTARIDGLDAVASAVKDMISDMNKEKQEEATKRKLCKENLNKNKLATAKAKNDLDSSTVTLSRLEQQKSDIDSVQKSIKSEIAEMEKSVAKLAKDREQQNKDFQKAVADQLETQRFLKEAIKVLNGFYGNKATRNSTSKATRNSTSFLQADDDVFDPDEDDNYALLRNAADQAPSDLPSYKKNGGTNSAIGLLEIILQDSDKTIARSKQSESDAQQAYEQTVQDTKNNIKAKNDLLLTKTTMATQVATDKATADKDFTNRQTFSKQLQDEADTLHTSCDALLKNFKDRQESFDDEVDSLKDAQRYLQGLSAR